jgi:hypothetical protein
MTAELEDMQRVPWHIEAKLLPRGVWRTYGKDRLGHLGFFNTESIYTLTFDEAAGLLEDLGQQHPLAEFRLVSTEFQTGIIRRKDIEGSRSPAEGIFKTGMHRRG